MHTRLGFVFAALVLVFGLGISTLQAYPLQLCGFTQFSDVVIIGAEVQEGSRLIIPSTWIQFVPHLYTLLGGGVIIRDPLELHRFIGGLTVANGSDLFGSNPVCTVRPAIEVDDPDLPSFVGSAVVLCVAGPSDPFQVTLDLTLTTCDEPGFPGGAVVQGQTAAGEAVNNQYHPK